MGNKPAATRYTEMRNVVKNSMGGRARIKPEIVPGILAWLVMHAKRYASAVENMKHRSLTTTVPGAEQYVERMTWACEHLAMLASALKDGFSKGDYADAATAVAAMLELPEGVVPTWDLDDEDLEALMPEEVFRGNTFAGGVPLQPGMACGPRGAEPAGGGAEGRPEGAGGPHLADGQERPPIHVPGGAGGGGPGGAGAGERGGDAERPAQPPGRAKRGHGKKPRN